MKRKIVIIPAFNEERKIAKVVETVRNSTDADVLVIDDASKDRTSQEAAGTGAFVIRHPFNMGYGAALQTGYKYALEKGYDMLVQLDGDDQHDPKHIPELFEKVDSCTCDLVVGSRFLNGQNYKAGPLKSIGIWFFRLILRAITGQNFTDPTSGYQCLDRKVIELFSNDQFPTDFPDANIIVMLHRMGFRVKEMPVQMVPNTHRAGMHTGVVKLSYYFFKVFLTIFIALLKKRTAPNPS